MPKKQADKLKVIDNPEKKLAGHWQEGDDLIDFPRPFRWAILGSVSCGKTSLVLNYLVKSKPLDNIFVLHPQTYNPNVSQEDEAKNQNIIVEDVAIPEYDGVTYYGMAYLPSMTFFDNIASKRNLLIIDDIDLCSMMKKRREIREERLNKLFSYVSSHKNLTIIVSSQDASSQLPSFVLKMCNVITVYQVRDQYIMQTLARKLSVSYKRLQKLMKLCKKKHDAITFDYTDDSPAELRLNIYERLRDRPRGDPTPISEEEE